MNTNTHCAPQSVPQQDVSGSLLKLPEGTEGNKQGKKRELCFFQCWTLLTQLCFVCAQAQGS